MVVEPASENTDYAVCARLCAARLRTYLAGSKSFGKKGRGRGIQYVDLCRGGGAGFKVAVSASLAGELPTLPLVVRALAAVPRSCFTRYSARQLGKEFKKAKTSAYIQKMAVLCTREDRVAAYKKVQGACRAVADFCAQHAVVKKDAACPGDRGAAIGQR